MLTGKLSAVNCLSHPPLCRHEYIPNTSWCSRQAGMTPAAIMRMVEVSMLTLAGFQVIPEMPKSATSCIIHCTMMQLCSRSGTCACTALHSCCSWLAAATSGQACTMRCTFSCLLLIFSCLCLACHTHTPTHSYACQVMLRGSGYTCIATRTCHCSLCNGLSACTDKRSPNVMCYDTKVE